MNTEANAVSSALGAAVVVDLLGGKGWKEAHVERDGTVVGVFADGSQERRIVPFLSVGSISPAGMVATLEARELKAVVVAFVDSDGAISYFDMDLPDGEGGKMVAPGK